MPEKPNNPFMFWQELKRRKVVRVILGYLATAYIILELISIIAEPFGLPDWTIKLVFVLLCIGFIIAVFLSWIFDITPEGIKKTENIDQKTPKSIQKRGHLNKLIIASLSIAVILLLLNQFRDTTTDRKDNIDADIISIAVLPLINLNHEDDNLEYFSDGVTQEIIDELAKIQSFTITAFSTTYQYKGKDKSRSEIAKELEVKYLIQGSAKIYRDSVWLSIELFNPSTKERVWNGRYNEVLDNAPTLQASIAKQVAHSLDIKLSSAEIKSLEKINTIDGEAFKLFLQAKAEISKLTTEGFNNTRGFLETALKLDPNYAQAHTLMAWNFLLEGAAWSKANNRSASATIELANPHIEKAIELDPKSSDIYLVRGNMHLQYTGLLKQAKKDVDLALKLNSWPKIPTNYCICTVVSTYIALGEYEKASELAKLAKEVDPGNVFIYVDEAIIAMVNGQFPKAQQLLKKAVDIYDIPYFNFYYGMSYYHDNKYGEAIIYLEKAIDDDGVLIALSTAYLSNAHFMLNENVESERYKEELAKRQQSGEHHTNYPMAMISAARNEREETLMWLKKAKENSDWGITRSMWNPLFKSIRNDPEFVEIRNKMLYDEWTNPK
ncbi:MAG: hypothetical protein E4G95_04030 [Bacteroidia bacterium]|nr:MAG: hypothetical protein E4G95_04030 [Bacteroidia bacterium]